MIKKKRVAALCKSYKYLIMQTNSDNTQWIGTGAAMYILAGIEPMSAESLASMLDYTEKDFAGITFSEHHIADELFAEENDSDVQIESPPKRVIIENSEYLIFETGTKLIFINGEYLKPIVVDDQTTYFMRNVPGTTSIALCVKKGFLPEAIIRGVNFDEKALNSWFDDLGKIINAVTCKYIAHLDKEEDEYGEQLGLEDNDDD